MPKRVSSLIPAERIEQAILFMRGEKVMLDSDLASLYQVSTGQLVRALNRNRARFPNDFAYQLTAEEFRNLKCQIGISSGGHGGRRTRPWVFTELGIAMLSSVLNSEQAIAVNIDIIRAFARLRRLLASHEELAKRLDALEQKYDQKFASVFEAIRR